MYKVVMNLNKCTKVYFQLHIFIKTHECHIVLHWHVDHCQCHTGLYEVKHYWLRNVTVLYTSHCIQYRRWLIPQLDIHFHDSKEINVFSDGRSVIIPYLHLKSKNLLHL
jgi:hypothetical protein